MPAQRVTTWRCGRPLTRALGRGGAWWRSCALEWAGWLSPGFEEETVRHIVQTSGGEASWACGKLVAEREGTKDFTLLFCDTLAEHWDTYRFLIQGSANVLGVP